jgi:hypothetical protein
MSKTETVTVNRSRLLAILSEVETALKKLEALEKEIKRT